MNGQIHSNRSRSSRKGNGATGQGYTKPDAYGRSPGDIEAGTSTPENSADAVAA